MRKITDGRHLINKQNAIGVNSKQCIQYSTYRHIKITDDF